jgi:hypothetical protein
MAHTDDDARENYRQIPEEIQRLAALLAEIVDGEPLMESKVNIWYRALKRHPKLNLTNEFMGWCNRNSKALVDQLK